MRLVISIQSDCCVTKGKNASERSLNFLTSAHRLKLIVWRGHGCQFWNATKLWVTASLHFASEGSLSSANKLWESSHTDGTPLLCDHPLQHKIPQFSLFGALKAKEMHTSNHECRCHLNVTKKCLQHKLSNYLLHVTCYNMWPRPISSLAAAQLQNTHVNLKPASCTHLRTHTHTHTHNTPSSSYLNLVFISSYYPALTLPTIWPLRTDQEKQLSVLLSLILLAAEQGERKQQVQRKVGE